MSWLGDVWKRNRNFVGNALKNVAPVVGALTGGVGGVAIGGLGAALGQAAREGSNIGDILKTGVQNAGITKAAQSLGAAKLGERMGMKGIGQWVERAPGRAIGSLTGRTTSVAPAVFSVTPPPPVFGAPPGPSSVGDLGIGTKAAERAADAALRQSLRQGTGGPNPFLQGIRDVGSWAAKNDKTAALALQGLGKGIEGISGAGQRAAEQRLTAAQAAKLEYELAQEQERQKSLEGLRAILAQQMPEFGKKRKRVWETDV